MNLKNLAACAETHTEPDPSKFSDERLKWLAGLLANAMKMAKRSNDFLEEVRQDIIDLRNKTEQADA